jgi:hypothetical protein
MLFAFASAIVPVAHHDLFCVALFHFLEPAESFVSVCSVSFGRKIGAERHGAALRSMPGFLNHAGLKVFGRLADGAAPRAAVAGLKAVGSGYRAIRPDDLPHDYERGGRWLAAFKPFDPSDDCLPH